MAPALPRSVVRGPADVAGGDEAAYYELRKAIRTRWCKRMAEQYGRTVSEEFGIRVDPVKPHDADGSGQYLTKVGYEMAMVDAKIGRGEGHRTPFAIAHTGDMADIDLYRQWVTDSRRKRSITWSQGLRTALDLGPEKSDEELAAEDAGSEDIAEVDRDLWRLIANRRDGARADFLACFETDNADGGGIAAAVRFLCDLGLQVRVDEAGPIPVIGLDHPPPNQAIRSSSSC